MQVNNTPIFESEYFIRIYGGGLIYGVSRRVEIIRRNLIFFGGNMNKIAKNILRIVLVVIMITLLPYVIIFNKGLSLDSNDWSNFGAYFGGVVTPVATLITLFWLIYSFDKQMQDMKLINKKTIEKIDREKKMELLNFYLTESQSRVELFRKEYHYKKAHAIEYFDLIKVELEEKDYIVKDYKRENYDVQVVALKNGVVNNLLYYEKSIWTIVFEFIGRVGEEKAKIFFENGGFSIGTMHMKSYVTQLTYLYRLLLSSSKLLEELELDNFVVRNLLSEQISQIKVLKKIDFIDDYLFYSIMSLLDKPDVGEKREFGLSVFKGIEYELEEELKVSIEKDETKIYRYVDGNLLNDIYLVNYDGRYYKRNFDDRFIKKWEMISEEEFIKLDKILINFS